MKYTVRLTRGGCYSNCDVIEAQFPGFLTVTVPGCTPKMYNIAEIRSLQPEPDEGDGPMGKLERLIREWEGESD